MKEKDFLSSSFKPNTESASLFMLNFTLLTREEPGQCGDMSGNEAYEPRNDPFASKVDRYLTGVLAAFSKPSSVEQLLLRLSDHDIEIFRRFVQSGDTTMRYRIYRTERDFLLISIGKFDAPGRDALPVGPEFKHGDQGQMGRNPGYFHFIFSYCALDPVTPGELAEVYKQLGMGFKKYSTILTYSAGMYYDLGERLKEAEFYNLARSSDASRRRAVLETKRNEFLDAYLAWKKQHTEAARKRVRLLAADLRTLDPGFKFKPE